MGTQAYFNVPAGLAVNKGNDKLYVGDFNNHIVRVVYLAYNLVSTIAGYPGSAGWTDGPATSALLYNPFQPVLNPSETTLYFTSLRRVCALNLQTMMVSTVAGSNVGAYGIVDGVGTSAVVGNLYGLAITKDGSTLWTTDTAFGVVKSINIATRQVTTVFSSSGVSGTTPSIDGECRALWLWSVSIPCRPHSFLFPSCLHPSLGADYGTRYDTYKHPFACYQFLPTISPSFTLRRHPSSSAAPTL